MDIYKACIKRWTDILTLYKRAVQNAPDCVYIEQLLSTR